MRRRPEQPAPSARELVTWVQLLEELDTGLERYTLVLTKEDRRRTRKFRMGTESVAQTVAKLAMQAGLNVAKASVEDMLSDIELAKKLRPLLTVLDRLRTRVNDTILQAESDAWSALTVYYSSLRHVGRGDPRVESALKPAADFFGRGKKRPKKDAKKTAKPGETPAA